MKMEFVLDELGSQKFPNQTNQKHLSWILLVPSFTVGWEWWDEKAGLPLRKKKNWNLLVLSYTEGKRGRAGPDKCKDWASDTATDKPSPNNPHSVCPRVEHMEPNTTLSSSRPFPLRMARTVTPLGYCSQHLFFIYQFTKYTILFENWDH